MNIKLKAEPSRKPAHCGGKDNAGKIIIWWGTSDVTRKLQYII